MVGQGIEPASYHPYVDVMPEGDLKDLMIRIRAAIAQLVAMQPSHLEFIERHCSAAAS
jgi:tryptophan halogenase